MKKSVSEEDGRYRKAVALNLRVADVGQALREIRTVLPGLGGHIAKSETVHDNMVMTVEIDSKNIERFFEKLGTVGELREKEPQSEISEGKVEVKIEIVKKPDR
jgi:hypothetical protein